MKKKQQNSVHIIGGGIAGLSLGLILAQKGVKCVIHEKEAQLGAYASGHNAGMIRTYEADPILAKYARRNLELLKLLQEEQGPFLTLTGLFIQPSETDYWVADRYPAISEKKYFKRFILAPENGLVDPRVVLRVIAAEIVRLGSEICLNSKFTPANHGALKDPGQPVAGSGIDDASLIVLANGSFITSEPFQHILPELPVAAYKRHLAELTIPDSMKNALFENAGIWWDELSGCYFRQTAYGVTATHGDQRKTTYYDAGVEEAERAKFTRIFFQAFPEVKNSEVQITDFRACLRTIAIDQYPVIGRVRNTNYFYFGALGGRGMSCALAFAEHAARLIEYPDLDVWPENAFSPYRFFQES